MRPGVSRRMDTNSTGIPASSTPRKARRAFGVFMAASARSPISRRELSAPTMRSKSEPPFSPTSVSPTRPAGSSRQRLPPAPCGRCSWITSPPGSRSAPCARAAGSWPARSGCSSTFWPRSSPKIRALPCSKAHVPLCGNLGRTGIHPQPVFVAYLKIFATAILGRKSRGFERRPESANVAR